MGEKKCQYEISAQCLARAAKNTGYGPPSTCDFMRDVPYAPYSKSDQIRRCADWTVPQDASQPHRQDDFAGARRRRFGAQETFGSGTADTYTHAAEEEGSFSVVDRISSTLRKSTGFKPRNKQVRTPFAPGARGADKRGVPMRRRWNDKPQRIRDSSVAVENSWEVIEEVQFSRLNKLHFEVEEPVDVASYNLLNYIDKVFDRVSTKQDKPLRRTEKTFCNPTTSQDPILRSFAKDQEGPCVFATDNILSVLMCAARSVYSWDIVIVKEGNKIYLDKRDQGVFDWIAVNENASEAPMEGADGVETINCPSKLSEEATYINRFFSQQILKADETYEFKDSHPDHDPESDAHYAYRYRQWGLGDDIKLFARTKIDAVVHQSTTTSSSTSSVMKPTSSSLPVKDTILVSIKALNEFDSRAVGAGGAPDWRQKIDSQRGAVMASELKNNGNKLAKWTVEALLAGTDQIRLGFCSRVNPRDRTRHAILGTTFFNSQINLGMGNCWGVLRAIVDLCLKLGDGKYVLLKDPNKPLLSLYSVPAHTFEDQEESEDEGEEVEDFAI